MLNEQKLLTFFQATDKVWKWANITGPNRITFALESVCARFMQRFRFLFFPVLIWLIDSFRR